MTGAVIYDRTSGDEDEGQDARGQAAATAARAGERFDVVGTFYDEGVAGDVDPFSRPRFKVALVTAERAGAVLVVREVSRVSREEPWLAMSRFAELERRGVEFVSLAEPWFNTATGHVWSTDEEAAFWPRAATLWAAWAEKRRARRRTQEKMTAFKKGDATPSGPVGRPPVEVDPVHLGAARAVLARGGRGAMAEAHREVLRLRGFFDAKDPRTAKARNVSKAKLGQLLGVYSVRKGDASETVAAQASGASVANGPVADGSGGSA